MCTKTETLQLLTISMETFYQQWLICWLLLWCRLQPLHSAHIERWPEKKHRLLITPPPHSVPHFQPFTFYFTVSFCRKEFFFFCSLGICIIRALGRHLSLPLLLLTGNCWNKAWLGAKHSRQLPTCTNVKLPRFVYHFMFHLNKNSYSWQTFDTNTTIK